MRLDWTNCIILDLNIIPAYVLKWIGYNNNAAYVDYHLYWQSNYCRLLAYLVISGNSRCWFWNLVPLITVFPQIQRSFGLQDLLGESHLPIDTTCLSGHLYSDCLHNVQNLLWSVFWQCACLAVSLCMVWYFYIRYFFTSRTILWLCSWPILPEQLFLSWFLTKKPIFWGYTAVIQNHSQPLNDLDWFTLSSI